MRPFHGPWVSTVAWDLPIHCAVGVPSYRGAFGEEQAARLLWRAGFGPKPGQAAELAKLGLHGAVQSLTRPKSKALVGPNPSDGEGGALAPKDAWGHDHLWWLDKMVRTEAPLVERMTLVWHDWFATSKSGVPQRLMIDQNQLLRRHALGNFEELAVDITRDPAMLLWLNGTSNNRWDVNENYARELQELFCLGAGRGYSERDVRQLARALTGFRNDWTDSGPTRFRYDNKLHDTGAKKIYGKRGKFGWQEGVRLVTRHRRHPEFMVTKLWGYFIPTKPSPSTVKALSRLYVAHGREVRPLLEAILAHPDLYDAGRRMVKPPVVQAAGMLRAVGRGIDTNAWAWLCDSACEYPSCCPTSRAGMTPAGWTPRRSARAGRWRSTSASWPGRTRMRPPRRSRRTPPGWCTRRSASGARPRSPARCAPGWRSTPPTPWPPPPSGGRRPCFPVLALNALRMLVATSPDYLTS